MLEWETIPSNRSGYYSRARIPGGWLVQAIVDVGGGMDDRCASICFVPDPKHEWVVKEKP